MKKILVLLAAVTAVVLVSCGTEIPEPPEPPKPPEKTILSSLEGTVWKNRYEKDEFWLEVEMAFSESEATFIEKTSEGFERNLTLPYSYDPPKVKIQGFLCGEVKDGVLSFLEPHSLDLFMKYILELH